MVEADPSLRENLLGRGHNQDDAATSLQAEAADPRRWEQLAIFVGLIMMSQFAWIMYTAVPDTSREAFNVPNGFVTFLATTCVNCEVSKLAAFDQAYASRYPMLYFPGSLFAARAMRRGGLRATIVESTILMVGGSIVKCIGGLLACTPARHAAFAATVVGQAGMALGQPHMVNSPAALGTEWFEIAERDFASTLGLLGNILGQALGEALSPIVVSIARSIGFSSSGAILVLSTFVLIPVAATGVWATIRFTNRTKAEFYSPELDGQSMLHVWAATLREDGHFVVLWIAFCSGISVFNTLLAIAAQWLAPCGYSAATVGFMTATFVLSGIPFAAMIAIILDATRAYRPAIKVLAFVDFAATLALLLSARRNYAPMLYVAFASLGAAMIASSAAIMETAVECTYPKPPEVSTGLLFCGGNVLSIAITYIFQVLLDQQRGSCQPFTAFVSSASPVATFTAVTIGLCCSLLVAYRGPYRRLEAESAVQSNRLARI